MKQPREKVAFVANVYWNMVAFQIPLIRLLQDKGYDVHVYAAPDACRDEVASLGVVCHDIPFPRSPFHRGNRKALRMLTASFHEEGFRMIHVHTPIAAVLARIAAKRAQVPTVMCTAHGFYFFKGASPVHWLLYYPIERFMARWTDYLITINQEDYHRAVHFPVRERVVFVPGVGVDVKTYQHSPGSETRRVMRESLGIRDDELALLAVAELNENKNQIQFLEAAKKLVQEGKKVKCLLVGQGRLTETLRQKVREWGMEGRVQFLGFRRDIPDILAAADVFLMMSKREGLPKALMEAVSAGLPVIATEVRGNRDLVQPGETGFLVQVGDVAGTAHALRVLYENVAMREEMARKNREMAAHLDVSFILRQMETVYGGALGNVEVAESDREAVV